MGKRRRDWRTSSARSWRTCWRTGMSSGEIGRRRKHAARGSATWREDPGKRSRPGCRACSPSSRASSSAAPGPRPMLPSLSQATCRCAQPSRRPALRSQPWRPPWNGSGPGGWPSNRLRDRPKLRSCRSTKTWRGDAKRPGTSSRGYEPRCSGCTLRRTRLCRRGARCCVTTARSSDASMMSSGYFARTIGSFRRRRRAISEP
mmetsp:Transcript_95071/g.307767  ORF Transcript_95071/g.307767 Transcript_95071/m.307767 type:complete len:203 (+) Transcript_95071:1237-1845(+)